ncbi:MAG: hypothetical protein HY291_10470 [Planctomycetes bacterium]|nr:hypothetical protein [Planctomycetota bacterium]
MSDNHRKILEMLSRGKISVADAERLIEKLTPAKEDAGGETNGGADENGAEDGAVKLPKFLRVMVRDVTGENINVRVPISLVRTGVRLGALLPKQARKAVEEQGVDLSGLSALNAGELAKALADLEVNVEEVDGGTVRIFCE